MWVEALQLSDLQGVGMTALRLTALNFEILVYYNEGKITASYARCPHGDVMLSGGKFNGRTVTCSGHNYGFDVQTGVCDAHDSYRLVMLPTKVKNEKLLVNISIRDLIV